MHFLVLVALSIAGQANISAAQTIDPDSVSPIIRNGWCDSQESLCSTLCNDKTTLNTCILSNFQVECQCDETFLQPDYGVYKGSLPYFICLEYIRQCVAGNSTNSGNQEECRTAYPCPSLDPSAVLQTSTSPEVSQTTSIASSPTLTEGQFCVSGWEVCSVFCCPPEEQCVYDSTSSTGFNCKPANDPNFTPAGPVTPSFSTSSSSSMPRTTGSQSAPRLSGSSTITEQISSARTTSTSGQGSDTGPGDARINTPSNTAKSSSTSDPASPSDPSSTGSKQLGTSQIIGIAVGIGVPVLLVALFFAYRLGGRRTRPPLPVPHIAFNKEYGGNEYPGGGNDPGIGFGNEVGGIIGGNSHTVNRA